jgi:hypothetical protein
MTEIRKAINLIKSYYNFHCGLVQFWRENKRFLFEIVFIFFNAHSRGMGDDELQAEIANMQSDAGWFRVVMPAATILILLAFVV